MDEDSIPPPPPPPPPFLTENVIADDNNDDIFPYFLNSSLIFPSMSQNPYYPTNGSLVTQNSQFAMENIDWMSAMINSKPMENCNQMPPSTCAPVLSSMDNTPNISSGGVDCQNNCINKRKGTGKTKKPIPPRVAFHTRSSEDILDDGYKWRKYGQKSVQMEFSSETLHNICKEIISKL